MAQGYIEGTRDAPSVRPSDKLLATYPEALRRSRYSIHNPETEPDGSKNLMSRIGNAAATVVGLVIGEVQPGVVGTATAPRVQPSEELLATLPKELRK